MKNSKQWLDCAQIRALDLVDYLAEAGHHPKKIRNYDYWYLSPLRAEKTPSFKINRKLNRWYDHGIGKGGNLVDFAILYHGCTIAELLQSLQEKVPLQKPVHTPGFSDVLEDKIEIVGESIIHSLDLLKYLDERRISIDLANQNCREVQYRYKNKIYRSIGFKNDRGGYELRNANFKNSSSPKGLTTIVNNAEKLAVFEGFFDYLSFLSITKNQQSNEWDYCILNSLSFFDKTQSFLPKYDSIHLFLDNDKAGQICSNYARGLSTKYKDESKMYEHYKDLNEWAVSMGKHQARSHHKIHL